MAAADAHMTVRVIPEIGPATYAEFADDDLFNRFTYHRPTDAQIPAFHEIRSQALDFARTLVAFCPPSAELVRALDHLDEAVMCANAAIARHPETTA